MKRFLFLTVLVALFVSIASLSFAAGPAKMFWLEPHIGDPCFLDLKIDPGNLKITSFYIVLSLEDIDDFNGVISGMDENIVTHVDNDQKVHVFRIAGMLETGFEPSTLLTINLGDQKRDINATFQVAEINGGPAEIDGLDVVERVINGKISFNPLQISFNGTVANDNYFVAHVGQKLIFTASGGTPPYKWEPTLSSPAEILLGVKVSMDTTTLEITPPDWINYDIDYLIFSIVLIDSASNIIQSYLDLYVLPGDTNLDGKVTAKDAQIVLYSIVDYDKALSRPQRMAAELTGNQTITTADAVLILQCSVGLNPEFPFPMANGVEDAKGAPSNLNGKPLTRSQQIAELKQAGVDLDTLKLLATATEVEAKDKKATTWGNMKKQG